MATVSGGNTNTVTVTSSFAEYYASMAEQYMDAAKEYCDSASASAAIVQNYVGGFDKRVTDAQNSLTAIVEQGIDDIQESIEETLEDVLAQIEAAKNAALQEIEEAKEAALTGLEEAIQTLIDEINAELDAINGEEI